MQDCAVSSVLGPLYVWHTKKRGHRGRALYEDWWAGTSNTMTEAAAFMDGIRRHQKRQGWVLELLELVPAHLAPQNVDR